MVILVEPLLYMVRYYTVYMIQCEYCNKGFIESQNGLAEKTFHQLLHDPETINK